MKNDPRERVKYLLAERWEIAPEKIGQILTEEQLLKWVKWFQVHPPVEDRIDLLIAEIRGALSDDKGGTLKKYMPDWGGKSDENIAQSIKGALKNGHF